MVTYGYIKDIESHIQSGRNYCWKSSRYNEDGTQTDYNFIETSQDLSGDSNIVIKGDRKAFFEWVHQFTPENIGDGQPEIT